MPGIQDNVAYKPGEEVTFDVASAGLAPPLTVQLRSHVTNSTLVASAELAPSGSGALTLPNDTPYGYYDLYVCGAGSACELAHDEEHHPAFIAVSDFYVGLDKAPIAPGDNLTFIFNAPGLALPLNVMVQGLDSDGTPNGNLFARDIASTSDLGKAVIELSHNTSLVGTYSVEICDGTVHGISRNVCYQGVIVVGEFHLNDVQVTPYPADAQLEFTWEAEGATLPLSISVYSGSGKIPVRSLTTMDALDFHYFDLAGLARGWYALWLCDDNSICVSAPFTYIGAPLPPAEVVPLAPGPAVQFDLAFGDVSCDNFTSTVEAATQLSVAHHLGVDFNDVDVSCRVVSGAPTRRALAAAGSTALTVTVSQAAALLSSVLQQAGGGAGGVALLNAVAARFTGASLAQFVTALVAAAPANTFTPAQLQALSLEVSTLTLLPTFCSAGNYAAGAGCLPCSPGFFSATSSASCTKCAANTYSGAASRRCTSCPSGQTSASGASACAAPAAAPAPLNVVGIAVGVAVGGTALIAAVVAWLCCRAKAAKGKLTIRVQDAPTPGATV